MVALLAEGHVLIEDYPGVGKTALARALRPLDRLPVRARAVHVRPAPGRRRRHQRLRPARAALRVPPRAGVRERRARRRDQPRLAEDAVGPARVHAGAPRHRRRPHARAGAAVPRARHPEPDRVRGHLSAARGAGRPLHGPASRSAIPTAGAEAGMLADHEAGDRVLDARRRWPTAAEVLAAQDAAARVHAPPSRCATTSSRCCGARARTRGSSSARARAPG